MTDDKSTQLAIPNERTLFDDDVLAGITSYKDAAAALDKAGVTAESASDYGTGFKVVDKATLVGVPFLAIEWRFNEGDYGDEGFVSVQAITKNDDKVIFNDGSTGVCAQLRLVTRQRRDKKHPAPQAGLICAEGLTKTTYYFNEDTGETSSKARDGKAWKPASTYYIAD